MKIKELFIQKPLEMIVAILMIGVGVGISALVTGSGLQLVGSAIATIGGAFLSHITTDINVREKAVNHLKPELQSTSRHLADTVTKINRNIQSYQSKALEAETAIDRIAQLTSGLYGTVNDLHILVGSPPDFQMLVDTVTTCEEMATKLESLTDPNSHIHDNSKDDLAEVRQQLESMRLQFSTAKKELGGTEIKKKDEKVNCPNCSTETTVKLGTTLGDSAMSVCIGCGQKFHIHRDSKGNAYTRLWGSGNASNFEFECVKCKSIIHLHFHEEREHEERYCMNCGSLYKILKNGEITKLHNNEPDKAEIIQIDGKSLLKCPKCNSEYSIYWRSDKKVRSICKKCSILIGANL